MATGAAARPEALSLPAAALEFELADLVLPCGWEGFALSWELA